ncbi:MAG: hypothetical protein Q9221_006224 [Calogaya cf. arnoldii]
MLSLPVEDNGSVSSSYTHIHDVNQEKRNALFNWNRRKPALTKRVRSILILIFGSIIIFALALSLGLGLGLRPATLPPKTPALSVVDLGYAQYQGFSSEGVDKWLGIRYAATPVGKLRFAAPAPPPRLEGIQSATQHGNICLSVHASTSTNPSSPGQSEDCLFLEVYAPSNATSKSNLPFGGNPNHVVLGGSSAGAPSVTLQLAAYGGRDEGLFHATAAESQSFGALRTVEES